MRVPARHHAIAQARQYGCCLFRFLQSSLGLKRPLLAGVKLTHNCNLACIHCPFHRRPQVSLSYEQLCSSLETLHKWGVRLVIFEGGEPFLWRDGERNVNDAVAAARSLFHKVGVTTNGTFPIETPADTVWVSIDGMRETHDRIRGKTFDDIVRNIESSDHPAIYGHVTINSLNRKEIPELVRFLADKVKAITIQFHYPYDGIDDELNLSPESRSEILDELIALKRQGLPLADSYACLQALKHNRWKCRPWLIASVDPDGSETRGCYVKGRGKISCERCGLAAHTELSLAFAGSPGAVLAGIRIFMR